MAGMILYGAIEDMALHDAIARRWGTMGPTFYRPMLTVGQLGMEMRRLRLASGLTQAELADRAGVSRRWLGQMERGHLRAEADKVMRVVRALGLAVRFEPARTP